MAFHDFSCLINYLVYNQIFLCFFLDIMMFFSNFQNCGKNDAKKNQTSTISMPLGQKKGWKKLTSQSCNCMPTWRRTQKSPRCPGDKMNYPQQGCNMSEDQKLQFLVVSQACKFRDDKGRKKKLVSTCRSDQLV